MAGLDPRNSTGNTKITEDKAAPSSIDAFNIISNETGKFVDISGGITEFKYYESIMQNTVRISVTYADSGVIRGKPDPTNGKSVIEGLPLVGSEKCVIKFKDNNKITIGDKPKLNLFVNKVIPMFSDTRKSLVTLELVSKEFFMNEKGCTRVVRRHDGKISDTVNKIFKDNLKTDKDYKDNIETTENNFNFIPNNKKPMYLLDWLSKKSVPEGKRGKSAGFFFWETYKGFHYRSIDWLLDKEKNKPKISIIFNDTGDDNGKDVPAGYQVKAIRYDKGNLIDVQNKFKMGFQSTRIILFNPFDGYYCVTPTQVETDDRPSDTGDSTTGKSVNEIETAGKKLPKMNEELRCTAPGKDFTRTTYYIKDTGTLNSGDTTEEQLKKSKEENFDFRLIENQAIQRYNQLYSSSTTITIPATFLLHAGDTVFIDDASLQVNTKNDEVDKEHGGLYLISDLIHYLDNTGTWTKINVVRDSFGRKGNAAAVGGN